MERQCGTPALKTRKAGLCRFAEVFREDMAMLAVLAAAVAESCDAIPRPRGVARRSFGHNRVAGRQPGGQFFECGSCDGGLVALNLPHAAPLPSLWRVEIDNRSRSEDARREVVMRHPALHDASDHMLAREHGEDGLRRSLLRGDCCDLPAMRDGAAANTGKPSPSQ